MARSAAYARIKSDVLRIVAAIPRGRLVTHAAIGAHLDVVPRHVAYILATLEVAEKSALPWHRVVGAEGRLGTPRRGADGRAQAEWLRDEGHALDGNALASGFARRLVGVHALAHGVPRQTRPVEVRGTAGQRGRRTAR
ncbi:MAG: MGMT family protein [Xanthomonadaceae bacterium]|jgi:methylated-DNA-protein-cysteine methyltransferase-like protein|nr:MGMT family protein [Xanthomonadaceae bacterium]